MRQALAVGVICLSALALVDFATAIVYIPGEYRDGVYIRPHFRESLEAPSKNEWMQHLPGRLESDDKARVKLPPIKSAPGGEDAK